MIQTIASINYFLNDLVFTSSSDWWFPTVQSRQPLKLRRHEFACGDSVERTVKSNILVVGCAGARPGTGDDLISKVSE